MRPRRVRRHARGRAPARPRGRGARPVHVHVNREGILHGASGPPVDMPPTLNAAGGRGARSHVGWRTQPLLMCTPAAQSRLPVCAGCLQLAVCGPLADRRCVPWSASGLQMTGAVRRWTLGRRWRALVWLGRSAVDRWLAAVSQSRLAG